ncbi:FxsA family protein [Acuticoccus kandeliae]|uniref:FxsA family protein n=1 Tax=Acuticoccus kandeliae TaxID=2073160 RepID=UPI00196ACDB3|nr:FxsA family protein [Acuticoccus kandeliae]
MLRLILILFLLAVPIAEIAVFMMVGEAIGVLPTIALVIITAVIGAYLLKQQGLQAFQRLQDDIRERRVPAASIGHALTIAIAGVLLLTPGFITDTVGFLLFIPAVREGLWRSITRSVKVYRVDPATGGGGPGWPGPEPTRRTIDLDQGDYGPSNPNTPWKGSGGQ